MPWLTLMDALVNALTPSYELQSAGIPNGELMAQ